MQLNREFFPDMTTTTQVDGSGMWEHILIIDKDDLYF